MAKDVLNKSTLSEEHEAVLQRVLSGEVEVSNKRFIHRKLEEYGFDDDMATVVLTIGTASWLAALVFTFIDIKQLTLDQNMIAVIIATYLQGLIFSYLMAKFLCDKPRLKRLADVFRRYW